MKLLPSLRHLRHPRRSGARPPHRGERGQSLIIIAVGMIGLLAFVGLTIDVGTLYIGVGHLRRAVDAAAIAAASQFREGRDYDQLAAAARQVINLNGVEPDTMELRVCVDIAGSTSAFHDQAMCPAVGALRRKLIRITATTRVNFSFLAIIGWFDTEIRAQAVSEAASVDVVLALDTSSSMTQDATDPTMLDPAVCNAADPTGVDGFPGECHPFEEVKSAAVNFVERLYYPYDRVGIVTFDIVPALQVAITNTLTVTQTTDIIRNLRVSPKRDNLAACTTGWSVGDPSGCTNTSIGGGLRVAGGEFGRHPVRVESVWVLILLTDGAANASEQLGTDPLDPTYTINRYCPGTDDNPTWVQPYCRDADKDTRHSLLPTTITLPVKFNGNNVYDPGHYDSDDYARDMADFVGCAPDSGDAANWCRDSLNYPADEGGQGALIYAVGLGRLVLDFGANTTPLPYAWGDRDAGDATLRYVAAVGDDGDAETDLCATTPVPTLVAGANDSYNCGNYYFSELGSGLTAVFESIASRLFTRLTQ